MDNTTFTNALDPANTVDEPFSPFDLSLDDEKLHRLCTNEFAQDVSHWEQEPWLLSLTDKENIAYLLGIQDGGKVVNKNIETPYVDNRLFASVRAILAYATGQPAKPNLLPSRSDETSEHVANQSEQGIYQHVLDHDVNTQMRLAVKNLITRKRGYLKLRYDEYYGPFGDICTENVDPADIVISREARYQSNPLRIWHRQQATIEKLVAKFPDKKDDIYAVYGIKRGTYTQVSRVVTYQECWFTYWDDGEEAEGVCWLIPDKQLCLGKMKNPNWIRKGSKKQQMIANMTYMPIKPFICLNYWNTGRSFIDETCLFDQARPMQDILNKRGKQIVENADRANPKTLVNGSLWDEADAKKFVSKAYGTIGLLNKADPNTNVHDSIAVIQTAQLPSYVMEDKNDARTEVDTMMGTPVQFRGQQPQSKNPTLGQDLLVRNQASALQDDLVAVINGAWRQYYVYLMQMMNVYLEDDYFVMVKGKDGLFNKIMLSSDNIDTNVRVTVTIDSTLPLDKQSLRATAIQLAQMNKIDYLTMFEDLGVPDPEKRAERLLKWELDRMTYMQSVQNQILSNEAEIDIGLIINGREPEERDDYNENYLNHWNRFMTTERFRKLDMKVQQKLAEFIASVADKAAMTEGLRDSIMDPSGMIDRPPVPKGPDVRIFGNLDPATSAAMVGMAPPQSATSPGTGSAPAPVGQASPPRMQNPAQFGTNT